MAWLGSVFAGLMVAMGISVGSNAGIALSALLFLLLFPPLWKWVAQRGYRTERGLRVLGALVAGVAAMGFNSTAYSKSPAGKAAAAKRAAEARAQADAKAADAVDERQKLRSGEHCMSSWDGSFPALKDAVKRGLRNPRSFEQIETVRSHVAAGGTFGVIMTYRAENGFGGMNVETVGAEVIATTCAFQMASTEPSPSAAVASRPSLAFSGRPIRLPSGSGDLDGRTAYLRRAFGG